MNHRVRILIGMLLLLLLSGIMTQAASAQQGVVWDSKFYNNGILKGPEVIRRQDSALVFNWGKGSPGSGVNVDNFSARFGTDITLPEGTYRFYVLADDGVQLFVDFSNLIINTFNQPRPGQMLTADIHLGTGSHHIQVDYREATGDAYLNVSWANLATNPAGPNFPAPVSQPPVPVASGAWTAQYYNNAGLNGSPIAILSEVGPSHNWGQGAPLGNMSADNFSARWTSTQTLEGTYQVTARADDGVRVYVDGVAYINEWHSATGQTYSANFSVGRGSHTIAVEYYEAGGLAFLEYGLQQINGGGGVPSVPVGSVGWVAQYFNNPNLAGSPVASRSENGPSQNWGSGAPFAGMPADNFSVRWSSVQPVSAGNYRITVRADDGVRVYVDGVARINEWHSASGQTYTVTLSLATGNHNFVIEYFEASGAAFVEYSLTRADNVQPYTPPPPSNTGAYVTVTSVVLNVRNAPNVVTGAVLTRALYSQTYPIVGRNVDSSWWQVDVNGTRGWVSGQYVIAVNTGGVPIADNSVPISAPSTGFALTANANVNLRSGPATGYSVVTIVPQGRTAQIIGRNASTTWWQVSYSGVVGWMNAGFVTVQPGLDLNRIPVAG